MDVSLFSLPVALHHPHFTPPNKIKAYCIFLSVFAEVCVFLSVYYIYNLSKFIISSSFFQR